MNLSFLSHLIQIYKQEIFSVCRENMATGDLAQQLYPYVNHSLINQSTYARRKLCKIIHFENSAVSTQISCSMYLCNISYRDVV